jgi:hypothetical protein
MSPFDVRAYRFWFVRLIDRLGVGLLGGALLTALVPYLLALILVAPFGDAGLYLRTPAFYIGFVGVALVVAASVQGVTILTRGLSELHDVAADPTQFAYYSKAQLAAAAHDGSNIGLLMPFAGGAVALLAAALHRWHHTGITPADHQFHAFLVSWRAPDALLPAGLAIAVFAVAVIITLGGSVILLVRNLHFAWRLHSFAYIPFPGRVRLGIRTLVAAYAWVSGTWSVGVALFALFFFRQWSTLSIVGIAVLASLGALTLAVPYCSFRKILDKAHDDMSLLLAGKVYSGATPDAFALGSLSDFVTVNSAITADPPPVLTRRGAIAYSFVQLVALATILAKDVLQEQVTFLAKESPPPAKKGSKLH